MAIAKEAVLPRRSYKDLHEHLEELERQGLLVRVQRAMKKETEVHPLVRWQYRGGIPEEERKAFLFENVTDVKGKQYNFRVAVAALAANPAVYAAGMGCKVEEISAQWEKAYKNPVNPILVESGVCQEEVHQGEDLLAHGGFSEFPTPISTPGFDNAPYTTCTHWFTRDPETGIQNIGNYRGHIKSPTRIGCFPCGLGQDIQVHIDKARKMGLKYIDAALVVGAPPVVSYAAVQKVPYGVDELTMAGGLAGEPIRVVKCKTVDITVPADAEIVFEGRIPVDVLEAEGPFGESHGYMHPRQFNPFMELTAVTHRKDAIWVSFISQVTPSESSVIKKVGYGPMFEKFLRNDLSLKSVVRVAMHEPLTNLRKLIVIQFRKGAAESDIWRALTASTVFHKGVGKFIVAVDEDIDPEDATAVFWAMCYRSKPHQDVQIIRGLEKGHAPPFKYGDEVDVASFHDPADESAMLINAVLKEPYPPISLPAREHMEHAKEIWEELGLPKLTPQRPWYGYSLGQWDAELEEEARLAVEGNHYVTGAKLSERRRKV